MRLYLRVCLLVVQTMCAKGSNLSQAGVYSVIPLCCSKAKVYNGSVCVTHGEILLEAQPFLEYEEPNSKHALNVVHSPLVRCSSTEDMLAKMDFHEDWRIKVMSNGSVTLKTNRQNSTQNLEFCLLRFPSEIYSVLYCKHRNKGKEGGSMRPSKKLSKSQNYLDCTHNVCISKCCPPGSHFSIQPFNCVPVSNTTPSFDLTFKAVNGTTVAGPQNVNYIVQFLLCKLYEFDKINLLLNGTLYLPTTGEFIGKDQYCLDVFETDSTALRGSVCSQTLILSFPERIRRMVNPSGFLISCILLAVTFICHVIIPKLRDMQGLCFMSYVAALFLAFLFLCINLVFPSQLSNYGCVGLALLSHYFLMTSFFWLNVMCFDIWTMMRGTMHLMHRKVIYSNERRTFIVYSIYAWGLPFLVSLATFVLHLVPEEAVSDYVIKPQFRKVKCWFPGDLKVLFAYYYGIVAFLLFVNTGFIIHTSIMLFRAGIAFTCCRIRKTIGESDDVHGNKRLLLHMFWHRFCLFSLMMLNWTTEVLSFIPPEEMWILTDCLNTLQGLFIFILFLRNTNKRLMLVEAWKKVIHQVRRKLRKTPLTRDTEMRMM